MANTDVENYNYNYAKECYMVYYAGNTSDREKYNNGKAVAESEKWKTYIIEWQSKDQTDYSSEATKEMGDSGDVQNGTKNGSIAVGVGAGVVGAAAGIVGKAAKLGATGTLIAAGIYAALGVGFLLLANKYVKDAQESMAKQKEYVEKAKKHLEYDFNTKLTEAAAINANILALQGNAMAVAESAGEEVVLSDTVASALLTSNTVMSLSATARGDEVAGGAGDKLNGINSEILVYCSEYDSIITDVSENKQIVDAIKAESPNFQKARSNSKTAMMLLAICGGVAVLGGIAGGIVAWVANPLVIAIIAAALFATGAILFGIGAYNSMREINKQKEGKTVADNQAETSEKVAETAAKILDEATVLQSEGNTAYQSSLDMGEQMAEGNANYTGEAA